MSEYDGLGLSEEEIAAMAEPEEQDELDGEGEGEGEEVEAAAEADADKPEEQQGQEAVETEAAVDAKPEQRSEPEQPQTSDPTTLALDKLNSELADIKSKFDSGDLSFDEYIDAKSAIDRQIVKAELKAELAHEAAAKTWERSQKEFLGQHAYLRENDVVFGAFAMQVNKLLADPATASLSDADLLEKAKSRVDAAFGRHPAEPSKKDESPIRKAKKEAADTSKAPRTLQGVPAAAQADDVDGGRFAYLDRLSGMELEAAVARLSPEDQSRWTHQ